MYKLGEGWTKCVSNKKMSIIAAAVRCLRFPISYSVSKPELVSKIEAKFCTF